MVKVTQLPQIGRLVRDEDLVYVVGNDANGAKRSYQGTGADLFGQVGEVLDYVLSGGEAGPDIIPAGEPIHLRHYGVRGNDNEAQCIDESAGIQRAITAAVTQRRRLIVPATNYLMNASVSGALTATNGIEMIGVGGVARFLGTDALASAGGPFFSFGTSSIGPEATFALARNIVPGDRRAQLASVGGVQPGMIMCLRTDQVWPYDGRGQWETGETHLIAAVHPETSEITVRDVFRDTYTIGAPQNPRLNIRPRAEVLLANIALEYQVGRIGSNCMALTGVRATLDNVSFKRAGVAGLSVQRSVDFHLNRISCEQIGGGNPDDGYLGYGVSVISCTDGVVSGLRTYACRRGIDLNGSGTAGPTRDITVRDFYINGGGPTAFGSDPYQPDGTTPSFGVGMHGPCDNAKFLDGKIINVNSGITIRGLDSVVDNVEFIGAMRECLYLSYGEGIVVRNCTVMSMQGSRPLLTPASAPSPACFIKFSAGTALTIRWKLDRPTTIVNNTFHGMKECFILGDNQPTLANITVAGNTISASPGPGDASIFATTATTALEIQNGIIGPNFIQRQYVLGTVSTFGANVTAGVSAGIDNVVQVSPGRYMMTIGDDAVKMIRLALAGILSGVPVHVRIVSSDSSNAGDFLLNTDGTSVPYGHIGGNLSTSANALSGTTGTDGRMTVSLTGSTLQIENRRGNARAITVTVA